MLGNIDREAINVPTSFAPATTIHGEVHSYGRVARNSAFKYAPAACSCRHAPGCCPAFVHVRRGYPALAASGAPRIPIINGFDVVEFRVEVQGEDGKTESFLKPAAFLECHVRVPL